MVLGADDTRECANPPTTGWRSAGGVSGIDDLRRMGYRHHFLQGIPWWQGL